MKQKMLLLLSLFPLIVTTPASSSILRDCAWSMCSLSSFQNAPLATDSPKTYTYSLEFYQCAPGRRDLSICWESNTELLKKAKQVKQFTLTKVALSYFPKQDLCKLANVEEINLERNSISKFTYPGGSCLTKTKKINLRENKLYKVDLYEYLQLPNLEELYLDDNRIGVLFVSKIPYHMKLRVLTAKRSGIHTVDISLVRIITISTADLSANGITMVTNKLKWNWKMQASKIELMRSALITKSNSYTKDLTLMIKSNNFTDPFGRDRLWGVKVGMMSFYRDEKDYRTSHQVMAAEQVLLQYSRAFSFLKVQAEGSSVHCNCRALDAYRFFAEHLDPDLRTRLGLQGLSYWLNLPCNKPKEVFGRTLLQLEANELVCHLQKNCPSGCTCTEYVHPEFITKVNCTGAALRALPDTLPHTQLLSKYDLHLRNNQVKDLRKLPFPSDIRRLLLANNLLTENSDFSSLIHYKNIKELDLRRNKLRGLPFAVLKLSTMKSAPRILLDENPIECSCQLLEEATLNKYPILYNVNCYEKIKKNAKRKLRKMIDFKASRCQRTLHHNSTSIVYLDRAVNSPHSQWMLVAVAVASGLIITCLVVATVVLLCKYNRHTAHRVSRRPAPMAIINRNSQASSAGKFGKAGPPMSNGCSECTTALLTRGSGTVGTLRSSHEPYSELPDPCTCAGQIPPDLVPGYHVSTYEEPRYVTPGSLQKPPPIHKKYATLNGKVPIASYSAKDLNRSVTLKMPPCPRPKSALRREFSAPRLTTTTPNGSSKYHSRSYSLRHSRITRGTVSADEEQLHRFNCNSSDSSTESLNNQQLYNSINKRNSRRSRRFSPIGGKGIVSSGASSNDLLNDDMTTFQSTLKRKSKDQEDAVDTNDMSESLIPSVPPTPPPRNNLPPLGLPVAMPTLPLRDSEINNEIYVNSPTSSRETDI